MTQSAPAATGPAKMEFVGDATVRVRLAYRTSDTLEAPGAFVAPRLGEQERALGEQERALAERRATLGQREDELRAREDNARAGFER